MNAVVPKFLATVSADDEHLFDSGFKRVKDVGYLSPLNVWQPQWKRMNIGVG
jgi:hypothetical protein